MLVAIGFVSSARAASWPGGVTLATGVGATDFALSGYRAATEPGAGWDVAVGVALRGPLAVEVGYTGSARSIHDPFGQNPTLTSTAVAADLRVDLAPARVQPFVFGGIGYLALHVSGRDAAPVAGAAWTSDASGLVLPIGGGLSARIGRHVLLDARFTYRLVPRTTLDRQPFVGTDDRPDDWLATLRVGWAF